VFSGIPPYCPLLQHITEVRSEQKVKFVMYINFQSLHFILFSYYILDFYLSFIEKTKVALTEYGVNAGTLSAERVTAILNEFYQKIDMQLVRLETCKKPTAVVEEQIETGNGYKLHMYGGRFHRVPKDWRFPRCGVRDLWRHWWLGDTVGNFPSFKYLRTEDVKHIDSVPLSVIEKVRKVGPNKEKRRQIVKVLTDMRFLCNYVTKIVTEMGKLEQIITMSAVDRMFENVEDNFLGREGMHRSSGLVWLGNFGK
jgi:hypothetical protein